LYLYERRSMTSQDGTWLYLSLVCKGRCGCKMDACCKLVVISALHMTTDET